MRVEVAWPRLRTDVSPRPRPVEHVDGQGTSCFYLPVESPSSFADDIRGLMKTRLVLVWSDYRSASELVLCRFRTFALREGPLRYERRETY